MGTKSHSVVIATKQRRRYPLQIFSLANGFDYGVIPEALEKYFAIFERRHGESAPLPFHTVKLTPKGGTRLDGHVITFEHNSPEAIGSVLPRKDIDSSIYALLLR